MSMHNKPLTDLERSGLEAHGLPIGKPSQLSDCFRSGVAWSQQRIAELEGREAEMAAQFVALQDAAIALIHASSEEEAGDAIERIGDCGEKQSRDILARHSALMQVEAMRHVANWLSGAIEEDCIGLDLGGEISGPTGCSDADQCRVAGERVFREAARIWEFKFVREPHQ
ncbi:hypothetical protein ACQKFL_11795 [Vreelandella titanicae]|uniref:hypothetical protein n=1 Tax=Vreelandella titanicae TaxID=664683 RepID=UPI003D03AE93